MPFLTTDVAVKQIDAETFELLEPLEYQGDNETFTVPAGFKTDFASVPRIFTWLIPRYGAYTKSAILHDFLGNSGLISHADNDGIFRRTMRELGVSFLRRWMMWAAVRAWTRLSGAKPTEILIWLLVTLPSVVFLFIPAGILIVWLNAFYLIEFAVYLALKPFSRKRVNKPKMFMRSAPAEVTTQS